MHLRRILWLSTTLALLTGAIVVAPLARDALDARRERLAAIPPPIPATDAVQADIVRALLVQEDFPGAPPPPPEPGYAPRPRSWPLLVDRTLVLQGCDRASCMFVNGEAILSKDFYFRDVPLKLRRELVLANPSWTPQSDPKLPAVDWITLAGADAVAGELRRGVVAVSRAVLAADGRQAAVVADHRCGPQCGRTVVYLLERAPAGWRIRTALIYRQR